MTDQHKRLAALLLSGKRAFITLPRWHGKKYAHELANKVLKEADHA